jgi:hypothetical protein
MRRSFRSDDELDPDVRVVVRRVIERGRLITYAVALVVSDGTRWRTVRLFDNAHGIHEMHRYTRDGGKQPGETFHHGTPPEALRVARREIAEGWEEMVRAWRR